jgi:hypothetical protein
MIVVDRHNRLRPVLDSLPDHAPVPRTWSDIDAVCGRFANWLVLAHHVRRRGDLLRALDALAHVHRHLLWMARLVEDNTAHWLTPSRQAETELTPPTIHTLVRSTAVAEDPGRDPARLVLRTKLVDPTHGPVRPARTARLVRRTRSHAPLALSKRVSNFEADSDRLGSNVHRYVTTLARWPCASHRYLLVAER